MCIYIIVYYNIITLCLCKTKSGEEQVWVFGFKTIGFLIQIFPVLTALLGALTSCKGCLMLLIHLFSLKDSSYISRGISMHSSTLTDFK